MWFFTIQPDFQWLCIWFSIILGVSSRFLDEYNVAEPVSHNNLISCVDKIARNFFRNRQNVLIISAGGSIVAGEIFHLMAPNFAINRATKDSRIDFGAIIDYIVLEGDDVTDVYEVVGSMILNPRGRYVIVTRDEPEDIEITAGRFWSAGIPNTIFVKPLIDGTVTVFGYGISSRPHHGNVTMELRVLANWKGRFTHEHNLFPNKFTNMNEYPLNVGIIIGAWYRVDMAVTQEHGEYKSTGIGSKILYEFADKLNFKIVLSLGPSGENVTELEVGDRLLRKDIDLTFGWIHSFFPVVRSLDYSEPFRLERTSFVMRLPRRIVSWNSMFQIFSIELWAWLLLALLASLGSAMGVKKLWTMNMIEEYIHAIDVLKVYFGQGVAYPKHGGLRLAYALWLLYAFLMVSAFTGGLLERLSTSRFYRDPETIEEVSNSKLMIISFPEFEEAVLETGDPDMLALSDRFETNSDFEEMWRQFIIDGMLSTMTESYAAVHNWEYRRNESALVRMINGNIFNSPYSYYMWKGHPYQEPLNRFIGQAKSAGLINKWTADLNALLVQRPSRNKADAVVLTLEHLASVFLALTCGCAAGILTFLYELYCGRRR